MYIKDLKGLKFPDNALIKFFFKNKLHQKKGVVLEFACSNGNNLALFANYDYKCIGVDKSKENINNGIYNFTQVIKAKDFEFFNQDVFCFVKEQEGINADVFLMPNFINYLKREDFLSLLKQSKEAKIYKKDSMFFLRTRSIKDYRYGLGEELGLNSFKMNDDSTKELNCINTLYQEHELVQYLRDYLNLYDFTVLNYDSSTVFENRIAFDSDIVIYGRIR